MPSAAPAPVLPVPAALATPARPIAQANAVSGFAVRLLDSLCGGAEAGIQDSTAQADTGAPTVTAPSPAPDMPVPPPGDITPSPLQSAPQPAAPSAAAPEARSAPRPSRADIAGTGKSGARPARSCSATSAAGKPDPAPPGPDAPSLLPCQPFPLPQPAPAPAPSVHISARTDTPASPPVSPPGFRADAFRLPRQEGNEPLPATASAAAVPAGLSPSLTSPAESSVPPTAKAQSAAPQAEPPIALPQFSLPAAPHAIATSTTTPTTTSWPFAPLPPAAQTAAALITIGKAPDGGQALTLQLHPAELGQVQIRIEQADGTQAVVHVTAERPQTLEVLMRDQPQLQHALDQAGIAPEGRILTFHLAPQIQDFAHPPGSGREPGFAATFGSPGQGGGAPDTGSDGGAGFQGRGSQRRASTRATAGRSAPRWIRAGINITA